MGEAISQPRDRRRTVRDARDWDPWRWPIDMPAVVQEQMSCAFDVKVVDLSLAGCRIWAGFRLVPGRPARITIDQFAPFRGRVAWAKDWYAGIEFERLIHPAVLAHLVARYPPRSDIVSLVED